MLLSELLTEEFPDEYADFDIKNVTSRVEEIDSKSAFVYLSGVFREKRYLLLEAEKRKPRVIISELALPRAYPHIRVKNARRTLSEMLYKLHFPNLSPPPIVAITGTNGKSSILQMLYHLFREKYKIGLIGTQRIEIDGLPLQDAEYTMTTPDPEVLYPALAEMQHAGCDYIFMEVSSHALALDKVSPLRFEIGLFTGISAEHLDFHKTYEEYVRAKEKIFSQCKIAVLNTDDKVGQEYATRIKVPMLSLGMQGKDIRILNPISNFMRNTIFTYCKGNERYLIKTPLLAPHNIYNSAFAFFVYTALDGNCAEGISRLSTLPQIKGRMECVLHSPTVILDYAHTPVSMECVLSYFHKGKAPTQKIVIVFGAGGDRDREKRAKMAAVAEKYSDYTVITTDNPRNESQCQIFKDIQKGFRGKSHRFITDRQKAVSYAYSLCKSGDILIFIGKGHEPYIIKKKEKLPYSEMYSLFLARTRGGYNEN